MSTLAQFIKYLEKNKLVKFDIEGESIRCSKNSFKIQKYVFLAKHFGLNVNYECDSYFFGPSSSVLADDCDELSRHRKKRYDPIKGSLPESFHSKDFLNFVKGRDINWLDTATILIDLNSDFSKRKELLECACRIASNVTKKFVITVLNEIMKNKHITLVL
jgi:uncharacterized protein YwgA